MNKDVNYPQLVIRSAELYEHPDKDVDSVHLFGEDVYYPTDIRESVLDAIVGADINPDENPELVNLLEYSVRRRLKNWRNILRQRQEQADQLNSVRR
jgi:hypothetical protein